MIAALVRRDPATRMALWLVPVAGMTTWPMVLLLRLDGSGSSSTLSVLGLVVPWLAGLSMIRVRLRSTELGLALPVSGPTLAAARMTALALYVLLPALAAMVVLAMVVLATAAPMSTAGAAMGLVVSVASALLLALLLVQSLAPGLSEVPAGPALAGAVLVGLMAMATALSVPGLGLSLLFLAAGAGLAAWTYRSVPPSLERTAPAGPQRADPVGRTTIWGGVDRVVRRQLDWSLPLWLALWLGWTVGSGTSAWVPFVLFLVATGVTQSLARIAWADPLPISRRRLLAYVALPALVGMLGGTLAGDWLRSFSPPSPRVRFELECLRTLWGAAAVCHDQVHVPAEDWRVAMGTPPTVSSSWGEQVTPPAHPVFWGVPVSIYNPYAVVEGSSRRFVALQMSRAIRDVYGRAIAPEEIARRYLRVDARGRVALAGDGLTVEEDYGLPKPPRRNARTALALVCALGWFASVGVALRIGPRPQSQWQWPSFRGLLWWVVLVVLAAVLFLDPQIGEWIPAAVLAGLRRLLPASAPAAAVVALAIGGVLFLLLGRLFARVELKPATGEASRPESRWRAWLPVVAAPAVFVLFLLSGPDSLRSHASTSGVWGLRVLLLLGTDVNQVDGDGETALHAAAYSGRSRAARLLLDHGARADASGKDGRTALHLASWSDDPEDRLGTFAALLDGGADPNARDADGETPLMDAAYHERTRALRLLVARGGDLEARDEWGRTPLRRAVGEDRTDSVRALLELGARLDATDDSGETVRQAAARRGDREILALVNAPQALSVAPAPSVPPPSLRTAPPASSPPPPRRRGSPTRSPA